MGIREIVAAQAAKAVVQAKIRLVEARIDVTIAKAKWVKAKKQAACKHPNSRIDSSVFGDTCKACGLFFNNGT